MRSLLRTFCLSVLLLFAGCVDTETYGDDPVGNFEALWTIMDEHYCFFDYKQIDWDAVYAKYRQQVSDDMDNEALFEVLGNMLGELKDGHVNLYASHDQARYWSWYEDYPRNYNEELIEKYLGTDYRIAGGIKYTTFQDNIGYISYTSFSNGMSESNLDEVLNHLNVCSGLIIDVRQNGGGTLTYATRLAQRFTNDKVLTGYILYKKGAGHSDFSDPEAVYLEPSERIRWQKPVVVLTNRRSFSATNSFVNQMRYLPHVTIMGDQTGGGSGLPFNSELPNGWLIRFSASPMLDANMQHTEFGIAPDVYVSLSDADVADGKDTIIEAARALLSAGD